MVGLHVCFMTLSPDCAEGWVNGERKTHTYPTVMKNEIQKIICTPLGMNNKDKSIRVIDYELHSKRK